MGQTQSQKNQTAAQQGATNLANTEAGIATADQALTQPFNTSEMKNGLPFSSSMQDFSGGQLAKQYAQARGALGRQIASTGGGSNLPSGFATTASNQLNAQQARDFDAQQTQNNLLNFSTKQQGAQALNPQSFFQGAGQGYGSVMGTPAQQNPWLGFAGGAAQGLLSHI